MGGAGCATRILLMLLLISSLNFGGYPRTIGASSNDRGKISRAQRYKIQCKIEIFCETKNKKITFLILDSWIESEPKQLDECRGLVTSDYQSFLEKQWIEDLRAKYQYKINQQVYDSIK